MAQLVIAAAGAAIGATFGMPAVGWAIGSALGGMMFAESVKIDGPQQPLMDLKVTGSEYGQPIPYVRGSVGIAGQMWWNTDRRPTTNTTVTESGGGGKGGGGGAQTSSSTTTYDMDLLIGLTDNEIVGVSRIWDNGKLIYTAAAGADSGSLEASIATERWTRLTVYTGSMTQLPDPTYEAAVGAANAPAYRGRAYVFIESLKLGQSGQIPNLTFEVVADGSTSIFWVSQTLPASMVWNKVLFANGQFVALGTGAVCATSPDGVTWTLRTMSANAYWIGLAWNGSVYCAIAFSTGAGTTVAATSPDGITWTARTMPTSTNWHGIAWNGTVFCAISFSVGAFAATSPDGITWTARTLPTSAAWTDIAWNGSVFCAVSAVATNAATSPDGITWTARTLPSVSGWHSIAWNGSVFCAVSYTTGAVAATSPDGITWTARALPTSAAWWGVTASGSRFYAVGNSASAFSDDNGATWTAVAMPSVQTWYSVAGDGSSVIVAVAADVGTYGATLEQSALVVESDAPTVSAIVSALCLRAGLSAGQIDVTGLSTITRTVESLALSQIAPTRQGLELLMSAYFFELVVSDKIYFRPRGSASVASIAYLELGAGPGDDQPEPLALRQMNELEIPAQIALTYVNISNDYQTDTQYSDRLISATAGTVSTVQMAIGMTPSEAKAVADTMLLDQAASVIGTTLCLLGDYCRLEPTDPVTVTGPDGSTFRLRLVKKTDSYPLLTFDAVLDDVSVLTSQGITSADYTSSTVVLPPVETLMELMDIPILQDADNDAGFYVATKGDGTPYSGSAVFNSANGVDYVQKVSVLESAIFGTCTTTLGDWTGPRVFDEGAGVTVDVDDGTLASSTRDVVLDSLSVNAMLIGSELVQFTTATLVSPGVYTLTGLLRGGRGSEWAMTGHAASERCVLLRGAGLRRVPMQNNELGLSYFYKGVTLGRALSSTTAESFTDNAVGLKPFSPFDSRITRDGSNNATITWQRRTRLAVRTIGALGISVPLGEDTEAYNIDIYSDGTYATVVDTLAASTTTVAFGAAEQTAAGLTPGNTIYHGIRQVSAQVGEGYELRTAA